MPSLLLEKLYGFKADLKSTLTLLLIYSFKIPKRVGKVSGGYRRL